MREQKLQSFDFTPVLIDEGQVLVRRWQQMCALWFSAIWLLKSSAMLYLEVPCPSDPPSLPTRLKQHTGKPKANL